MFQKKLVEGSYFDLSYAAPGPVAYAAGDFVTAPVQDYSTNDSTTAQHANLGKKVTTRTIQPNVHATKAHRNFRFLPWYSGAISEVRLDQVDVLTGPMSGCWLVIFRRGGHRYAGHLGTDVANPVGTAAVKTAWNNFATNHPGDVVGGFNPFAAWKKYPASKSTNDSTPRIFGLYTTNAHFHAVFTWQQGGSTTLRIADVKRVKSASLATLQNL